MSERGRQKLVTEEAFEDLKEAMKKGQIATICRVDEFLRERHGIEYAHPDGVGSSQAPQVQAQDGSPRHEEADSEQQEAFKKTTPTPRRKRDRHPGKTLKVMASTRRVSG